MVIGYEMIVSLLDDWWSTLDDVELCVMYIQWRWMW